MRSGGRGSEAEVRRSGQIKYRDILTHLEGVRGVDVRDLGIEELVAVRVDPDIDHRPAIDQPHASGAIGKNDAERVEVECQVQAILAPGCVAVEALDYIVAVELAGVDDGVVA